MFRVKIQEIIDGKKKTVFDRETEGFNAVVQTGKDECAEVGGGLSMRDMVNMILSSRRLKEACEAAMAVQFMMNNSDVEDELIDRIGGLQ